MPAGAAGADAVAELERTAGSRLDPGVVAALVEVAASPGARKPARQLSLNEPGPDAGDGDPAARGARSRAPARTNSPASDSRPD
jgi:hypothetical protein